MAKQTIQYQNNPFFIGLNGLQLLFKRAQSVGIYAAVLVGVSILVGTAANVIDFVTQINDPDYYGTSSSTTDINSLPSGFDTGILIVAIALIVGISLAIMLVSLLLYGVLEYTSARLAHGEDVNLGDAFKATLKNLLGYLWVYIVMIVKIFLWTLLLIVPGIIMSVRYSLAGTVFFAENKHGNAAVKRSAELTKGAWFTTFAGTGLWNLITFGQITWLINPSANAILYRQLRSTTDHNVKKPSAHWLSWLTFFGPIAVVVLLLGAAILLILTIWLAAQ